MPEDRDNEGAITGSFEEASERKNKGNRKGVEGKEEKEKKEKEKEEKKEKKGKTTFRNHHYEISERVSRGH